MSVLEEMRRVVRPGGWVIVSDFVTDEDGEAPASAQSFVVRDEGAGRTLAYRNSLHRRRVP